MELFQCLLKLLQKSKNYRAKSEALDKNENISKQLILKFMILFLKLTPLKESTR